MIKQISLKSRKVQFVVLLVGVIAILLNMSKIKNLSPSFKIPLAEKELELQIRQVPMGSQQGGLSLFSNKFKRGYGDAVFGSDENGIWLGAAEFVGSPFNVGMDGAFAAKSGTFTDENDTTIIDAKGLVSTASFNASGSTDDALGQVVSSTSTVDVTGATLDIELEREALVLFLFDIQGYVNGDSDGQVFPNIGGSVPLAEKMHIVLTAGGANDNLATYSTFHVALLSSGTTTYKLQANLSRDNGADLIITRFKMSYIVFGK